MFDPAVPGSGRPWPVKGTGRGQGTAMTHPGRVPGGPHPGLATPSMLDDDAVRLDMSSAGDDDLTLDADDDLMI